MGTQGMALLTAADSLSGTLARAHITTLDLVVLAVILIFALLCAAKGFVKACFGFLPTWVALIGTYFLYPKAAAFLRTTFVYEKLRTTISQNLNLEALISEKALQTQTELIQALQVPEFLKVKLLQNNNPVIYKLLDAETIQDYIHGFLANIGINILAMLFVFLILFAVCWLVLLALNLVAKLPVLSTLNRLCGFVVGAVQGVVWIWVFGIFLTFCYYSPWAQPLIALLRQSTLALWLYENNWLLFMVLKVFS